MTLAVLMLAFLDQSQRTANEIWCGKPSAVFWKNQLFVEVNGRAGAAAGGLYRGTYATYHTRVDAPVHCTTQIHTGPSNLAKMELRDGRLLFFGAGTDRFYIVPLVELPGLESNEFGEAVSVARGHLNSSFLINHYSGVTAGLLFPKHRKEDVFPPTLPGMVSPKPERDEYRHRAVMYWCRARCDIQIAGPKTVRLFHAYKDKLFVSVELDYLRAWYYDKDNNPISNPPPVPDRELRTGKLPADFTDHFSAYTASGRDYLLSDAGKLYLVAPKGKAEVEVTKVWDDPKQKIVGVVQDQDKGAVCGWGYAGANGSPNRFYVKFDPKPNAVAYKLTVPMWHDPMDAYLESYECVRAFRKD